MIPIRYTSMAIPQRGRVYLDDGMSHDFEAGAFLYDDVMFDGPSRVFVRGGEESGFLVLSLCTLAENSTCSHHGCQRVYPQV